MFQKLENECGNKYKWKTPCSLRETRCFQACLGICTNYLSIRLRLLRYYMVGHSQDRTLWNKTMSIFESSDLWRSTMGNGHNDNKATQNPTEFVLYTVFFSSKGHCMNIAGHFQGLCFCNFGWGVPFVIL